MHDIRFAIRSFLQSPAAIALALIATAFGIGANTAVFSVIRSVLLRPLSYREPVRLVALWESNAAAGATREQTSLANYADWRDQNQVFTSVSTFAYWVPALTGDGEPEQLLAAHVTANFFTTLGVQPAMGRDFTVDEDRTGNNQVVILSDGLWRRRLGSDPHVLGKKLMLDKSPYTIVGVMAPDFQHPNIDRRRQTVELWRPMGEVVNPRQRRSDYTRVVARLKPGVTFEEARSRMADLGRRLARQYPAANAAWQVETIGLSEAIAGDARRPLWMLLAAVALLQLIACANTANLLLARATERRREFAIRAALGGGRVRLIRQMLTESVLLSLVGGAGGILLALWLRDILTAAARAFVPDSIPIELDGWVLGFALATSIVTGLLFGALPAVEASRADVNEALKSGGRANTRAGSSRPTLLIAELALTMMLLTGAGLLIRSFWQVQSADLGYRPDHVLTGEVRLKRGQEATAFNLAFMSEMLDRVKRLPGVDAAAMVEALPLSGRNNPSSFFIEGRPDPPQNVVQDATLNFCTPEYFRVAGMRLLRGRWLDERDGAEAQPAVVINDALARRYFPGEDPIGKRLKFTPKWQTIAGVVADIRHTSITADPNPQVYLPYAQFALPRMTLTVRTAGDPVQLIGAIRREFRQMDPNLPFSNVRTMEQMVAESVAPRRLLMLLLSLFAGLAVVVAAVGVYGVISYSVARRTQEIGLRMALGAKPADVLAIVLSEGGRVMLAGLALGTGLSLIAARWGAMLLYGVGSHDPATLGGCVGLLAAVSLVAMIAPAWRATQVNPAEAMRPE